MLLTMPTTTTMSADIEYMRAQFMNDRHVTFMGADLAIGLLPHTLEVCGQTYHTVSSPDIGSISAYSVAELQRFHATIQDGGWRIDMFDDNSKDFYEFKMCSVWSSDGRILAVVTNVGGPSVAGGVLLRHDSVSPEMAHKLVRIDNTIINGFSEALGQT